MEATGNDTISSEEVPSVEPKKIKIMSVTDRLFEAVKSDDLDLASDLIITHGAAVNEHNVDRLTPLHIAVDNANVPMVKMLAANGADTSRIRDSAVVNLVYEGDRPYFEIDENMHPANRTRETLMMTACRVQNLDLVDCLLDLGCYMDIPKSFEREARTPLQWAAHYGNLELVQRLLDRGADVNSSSLDGNALHCAASQGHTQVAECLLDHGCDANVIDCRNCFSPDWKTPLDYAIDNGHFDMVPSLCERSGTLEPDVLERGLFSAATRSSLSIVQYLIGQIALVKNQSKTPNDSISTPCELRNGILRHVEQYRYETHILVAATRHNNPDTVQCLLEHGCSVDVEDEYEMSAFGYAFCFGAFEVMKLLAQAGARIMIKAFEDNSKFLCMVADIEHHLLRLLIMTRCDLASDWRIDDTCRLDFETIQASLIDWQGNQISEEMKEQWEINRAIISDTLENAGTLKNLCRFAVRRQLKVMSNGDSFLPLIRRLPVPRAIQEYLRMDLEYRPAFELNSHSAALFRQYSS